MLSPTSSSTPFESYAETYPQGCTRSIPWIEIALLVSAAVFFTFGILIHCGALQPLLQIPVMGTISTTFVASCFYVFGSAAFLAFCAKVLYHCFNSHQPHQTVLVEKPLEDEGDRFLHLGEIHIQANRSRALCSSLSEEERDVGIEVREITFTLVDQEVTLSGIYSKELEDSIVTTLQKADSTETDEIAQSLSQLCKRTESNVALKIGDTLVVRAKDYFLVQQGQIIRGSSQFSSSPHALLLTLGGQKGVLILGDTATLKQFQAQELQELFVNHEEPIQIASALIKGHPDQKLNFLVFTL